MELFLETSTAKMKFELDVEDVAFIIRYALEHAGSGKNEDSKKIKPANGNVQREGLTKPVRKAPMPDRQNGYKGFMLIKCRGCGKTKGFSTKTEIKEFTCDCGAVSELEDLIPAYLDCSCGAHFHYQTNVRDSILTWNCLNCYSPVDMRLNDRESAYVTINHAPSYYQKGGKSVAV